MKPFLLPALTAFLLLLPGCDSLLDDVEPVQEIDAGEALRTPEDVAAALIGAYNALGDPDEEPGDLYGGMFQMLPDLLAGEDELAWIGTFEDPREVWRQAIGVDNLFTQEQWVEAYEVINITNHVLGALDLLDGEDERARVEGEAKFLRGVTYFELVRVFALPWNAGDPTVNPGVPLVLKPTRSFAEADPVTRASVAAVYEQVLQDLTDARDLLAEENGFFADTYAAGALLSRVHLMQADYAAARDEADRVIASGEYELADTYEEAFNNREDIREYVFAIQVTSQDGDHGLHLFYAPDELGGRGAVIIESPHLDLYEPGDARLDLFFEDDFGTTRTGKWKAGAAGGANIPVVRLAELYLTRAEANLREGTAVGATPLEDVNRIRARAGLPALDAAALDLDAILQERHLELAFEGHHLHDHKRTGRDVGPLPFDSPRLVYPIPQREVEGSKLEQNPGY